MTFRNALVHQTRDSRFGKYPTFDLGPFFTAPANQVLFLGAKRELPKAIHRDGNYVKGENELVNGPGMRFP